MLRHLRLAAPFLVLLVIAACSGDRPGDTTSNNNYTSLTGPSFDDKDKKGDLCGRVWIDTNCDGIQQEGEKGVKNVTVYLLDCDGNVLAMTTTDDGGNYCFLQIAAGDYKVRVELPDGYEFAPQDQGSDDMIDSDVDMNGMSDCATVEDAKSTDIDAGLCEREKKGDDGCTPGYWKTKPYDAVWGPTGYHWDESFNDVFGCDLFDDDVTLLDAMWQGGGGIYRLGRHGVAALLNAAHPDVDYPYSVAEVIDLVCDDGDASTLADANEAGCPIDAHGNVIGEKGDDDIRKDIFSERTR
jgi:hypothetical protein